MIYIADISPREFLVSWIQCQNVSEKKNETKMEQWFNSHSWEISNKKVPDFEKKVAIILI